MSKKRDSQFLICCQPTGFEEDLPETKELDP